MNICSLGSKHYNYIDFGKLLSFWLFAARTTFALSLGIVYLLFLLSTKDMRVYICDIMSINYVKEMIRTISNQTQYYFSRILDSLLCIVSVSIVHIFNEILFYIFKRHTFIRQLFPALQHEFITKNTYFEN